MDRNSFLYKQVQVPEWDQIGREMVLFQQKLGLPSTVLFRNVEREGALDAMPTLKAWFGSLGLKMAECVYIVVPPGVITNVHKDIFAPNCLALNFPVSGCETVRTHWYRELVDVPFVQPGKNPHYEYKPNEIQEYDSTIVSVPTMLNVHVLHSVNNLSDKPRIVFSFRFREAPWRLVEDVDPTLTVSP
jgi:hypothetical protein